MKAIKIISAGLIFMILLTSTVSGQRARKERKYPNENRRELRADHLKLTEDQKAKVAELRSARLEANKERRKELTALRQQKRQLMQEKKPDLSKVNEIVDKMASIRASIQKENIKYRQEFKSLLTDDQRESFKEGKKREKRHQFRRSARPRAKSRN